MTVLSVENLTIRFRTDEGLITAVEDVSFDIQEGEVLGLVGESGSGKSVTAKACMQLNGRNTVYDPASKITLHGDTNLDVLGLKRERDMLPIRGGEISMIFQEPMASFAPAISVGAQMVEQLMIHTSMSKKQARELSIEMLDRVGITEPTRRFDQYVFEYSGGMRQRAMIAMALSTKPRLLIADEPTTALDVTIQRQVIDLMKELIGEFGMSILFITHDLGVIAQTADRVAVMYLGRILERGPVRDVLRTPAHAYTRGLLRALPNLDDLDAPLVPIPGDIPSPLERPSGCVFHTRNPELQPGSRYEREVPPMSEVRPGHYAALFPEDVRLKPLVKIDNLTVAYPIGRRLIGPPPMLKAVKNVSLDIPKGGFVGLVGESGSGKTTLGRAILKAAPISEGSITYDDGTQRFDIASMGRAAEREFRAQAQLIFQDPYAALSPRMTVRDIIAEPLEVLGLTKSREETDARVREIAGKCRINLEHLRRYPHAFSGGQRQRISIARTLVSGPRFVVADECVAALDVSIQADILNLLKQLQRDLDLTFLFISHDLSAVAHVCDSLAVMYLGEIVEAGPTREIFANPQNDYTRALLSAIPSLDPDKRSRVSSFERGKVTVET